MKKYFLIFFLVLTSIFFSRGIIIGDDLFILRTFRDSSPEKIEELALNISKDYDAVVLHLGSRYPFERGSFFFYRRSKENLYLFSKYLNDLNVKFYLWIFDSFGGEQFLNLYEDRHNLIKENLEILESLNIIYDGIIIDLEWINLDGNFFNNKKYIEFLQMLREQMPQDKELKAFASLIDSDLENIKRGYDIFSLFEIVDSLIPMLYIIDGDFYKRNDSFMPYLNDNRVNSILKYYSQYSKISLAISQNRGIIIERDNFFYFIKTVNNIEFLPESFLNFRKDVNYYYDIYYYRVLEDTIIIKNDESEETIYKDEIVYYYAPKNTLTNHADYFWEYYLMNKE
jgi:hypothetical protein